MENKGTQLPFSTGKAGTFFQFGKSGLRKSYVIKPKYMIWRIIRGMLFCLPPEFAHWVGGVGLRFIGYLPEAMALTSSNNGSISSENSNASSRAGGSRHWEFCGRRLCSPLGLAAGFDKNGEYIPAMTKLGFGFVEIGTVTPVPQSGNPRPRLFRLPHSGALINRLGFNGQGAERVYQRLVALSGRRRQLCPIGINIGKNKSTPIEAARFDYEQALRMLYAVGDFFVVNLSSPNTPGLRELQSEEYLGPLLQTIREARNDCAVHSTGNPKPLLLKISPDMDQEGRKFAVEAALAEGFNGVVATNTTTQRELPGVHLRDSAIHETGGLSGRPLQELSKIHIKELRTWMGSQPMLISVGGLQDEFDAEERLSLGADLLEVYTQFIYEGPSYPRYIRNSLR